MTLQFGSGVAQTFTSAPTAGTPSIAIGNGTFGGGAPPDFQGTAAIGVNMVAGFINRFIDLQRAGASEFSVAAGGNAYAKSSMQVDGFVMVGSYVVDNSLSGSKLDFSSKSTIEVLGVGATHVPFSITGDALQTADLIDVQDSGSVNHFGVMNAGTDLAPVWALRVAPVANAASMAQAHVGGVSTGKAIQVIDNAGTTIGWLQLVG